MMSEQGTNRLVGSVQGVVDLIAHFSQSLVLAIDNLGRVNAASSNAMEVLGTHPTSLLKSHWTSVMSPLDFGTWGEVDLQSPRTNALFCWQYPLQAVTLSSLRNPHQPGTNFISVKVLRRDDLTNAIRSIVQSMDKYIFPICITDDSMRILMMSGAARNVLGTKSDFAPLASLFDTFGYFPKKWEIEAGIAMAGLMKFESLLPASIGFHDQRCSVSVFEISQPVKNRYKVWLIIPEALKESSAEYVSPESENSEEDCLARTQATFQHLYDLGLDVLDQPAVNLRSVGLARGNQGAYSMPFETLSPRQRQILFYFSEGMTIAEIAAQMELKQTTVKSHIAALYRKLSVRNKAEALMIAERENWLVRLRNQFKA